MHGVGCLDPEPVDHAFLDHEASTPTALFSRLEQEYDLPCEISCLGKVSGSAKKHCHVAIVAAGVHDPLIDRTVLSLSGLFQRKGVHVSSQCNGFMGSAPLKNSHDPGPGPSRVNLKAVTLQFSGNDPGCSLLLKSKLGMLVQILA